jgi:hypothetical protein
MSNEDFGYMIEKERRSLSFFSNKPLKIIAVLTSIIIFVLTTLSAYYFVNSGQDESIQIVESPKFEIKVRNKDINLKIKNIDKTIYDNIVGSKGSGLKNKAIKVIKTPKTAKPKRLSKDQSRIVDDKVKQNPEVRMSSGNISNIKKPYSRVQLAAVKSKDSAYKYWVRLKKEYPKLFNRLDYFIQRVDLGKRGVFYRLQIGNFRNQLKAEEFCVNFIAKSRKKRSNCIIVE